MPLDEITRLLRSSRAHFDNVDVRNGWHIVFSTRYDTRCYSDEIAHAIRLGNRFDSRRLAAPRAAMQLSFVQCERKNSGK